MVVANGFIGMVLKPERLRMEKDTKLKTLRSQLGGVHTVFIS